MPFSCHTFLNLIKKQIPTGYGRQVLAIQIGLATTGVCVFLAVTSVAAFFISKGDVVMKKQTLAIVIFVMLAISCVALTACHSCEFGEWTVAKQPTCTQDGSKERVCECGEKETEVVPATGHTFGEWTEVKAPTCTETGLALRYCHCAATETRVVEATGHSHEAVVTDPTCTEKGYTTHACHCGDSFVDTYVDATGHSYEAVVTAPTCTEQGYTTHTCHCGDSYVDTYVEATGHSYVDVVTAPGCMKQGYTTHSCNNCDYSYKHTYVDATGHNFQEADTCSNCGRNIVDVAVKTYNMSATSDDNVQGYLVARPYDDYYDTYIKGAGGMKDYSSPNNPFRAQGYYSKIVNVYIEESVTSIGNSAFEGCKNLTSITIPSSVTSIGYLAFVECIRLTSITIPSSVTSMGDSALHGCAGLTNIVVDVNNSNYKSIDGNLYSKDGKTLIQYALGKTDASFTIPSSVTSIGYYAFYAFRESTNLTSVTFADPNGWYVAEIKGATRGYSLTLTDQSQNAKYLTSTYYYCYWYKAN